MSNEQDMNDKQKLYYQIYADDIRHSKTQKWNVVNYGVLIQGGIITYFSLFNDLSEYVTITVGVILCILSILIALGGGKLIFRYQKDIGIYRKKMKKLPGDEETEEEEKEKKNTDNLFNGLFIVIFWFSALASISYIITKLCEIAK